MTTTRYAVNRPLLDLARRVRRSPMARDIHAGLRNRFLPGIGALGCLFVGLLVFRGLLVAADMAGLVTP
jgi:hypothetical protein